MSEYIRFSDDDRDPNWRFRVEFDEEHRTITVSEEDVTSRSESAQVTNVRGAVDFYPHEIDWLIDALVKAREDLRESCK